MLKVGQERLALLKRVHRRLQHGFLGGVEFVQSQVDLLRVGDVRRLLGTQSFHGVRFFVKILCQRERVQSSIPEPETALFFKSAEHEVTLTWP